MAIITRQSKGSALTHAEVDNNFTELDEIPNGKVFPKDQNIGIKVDLAAPTFPWRDLTGEILVLSGAPNPASYEQYRGGIYSVAFDEGDSAFINFHLPHDYAVNTPIFIHAHWSHKSATVTGGSVTFGFELMYAKGHNEGAFSDTVTSSVLQNASTTQYQHLVAEVQCSTSGGSLVALDTNLLLPDGVVQCRAFLDSNDITTSDMSTPKPFIHFVDIHYQSTNLGTKNRQPSFWG